MRATATLEQTGFDGCGSTSAAVQEEYAQSSPTGNAITARTTELQDRKEGLLHP
jgi:hypothetical protein